MARIFPRRYVKTSASDGHYLAVSRVFTAFWGIFACFIALEAGRLGSAIEVVNKFGSYFYGSILGVFGLAVLTPSATPRGAFYGLLAGMTAVFLVSQLTPWETMPITTESRPCRRTGSDCSPPSSTRTRA